MKTPEAEVRKSDLKLNLPPVPAFDLPAAPADGSHTVKEMRVKGKKLLESEVTVKGVITWAYDCPTAIRQPTMSEPELKKMIEEDPSKCERPKFFVGDTADTPAEKSLWVVEVPRPYYKIELERLPKEELRNPPADRCDNKDPRKTTCPPYKVGDQVEITGTWKLSSPHSERNSDGLLVFKRMKNVTQSWESPVVEPKPGAQTSPPGPTKPSPQDLVNKGKGRG
ncbi:MAG: hypothetical protein E6J90_03360 [Deltaproteobacteria bacterium]|nr:MAG: hypothetical protein E6J91_52290 [Deltaproteobacteria bacterium]TMQ27020.1 MAG: hypothetical protein E6J90_03360 [Deltaproteobacteria bacterium]